MDRFFQFGGQILPVRWTDSSTLVDRFFQFGGQILPLWWTDSSTLVDRFFQKKGNRGQILPKWWTDLNFDRTCYISASIIKIKKGGNSMGKLKEMVSSPIESIYGLDLARNGGNMTVCKSIPLLSLVQSPMTLFEMKLFDIYLGRIHPQNPDVTRITFEKSELEELLGVDKINNSDLNKALHNLMSRVVTVYDGYEKIFCTLLSTARLSYIDKDHERLRAITMECSDEARKYIYNISSIKYIKMSLHRLVSFDSRHAYSVYQYLNVNSYRSHWEVGLYELKAMLGLPGRYPEYRDFNKRVLQPALEEINQKTELKFTYEPVIKRNKIQGIRFNITHTDEKLEKSVDVEVKKNIPKQDDSLELPVYNGTLEYDFMSDIEF